MTIQTIPTYVGYIWIYVIICWYSLLVSNLELFQLAQLLPPGHQMELYQKSHATWPRGDLKPSNSQNGRIASGKKNKLALTTTNEMCGSQWNNHSFAIIPPHLLPPFCQKNPHLSSSHTRWPSVEEAFATWTFSTSNFHSARTPHPDTLRYQGNRFFVLHPKKGILKREAFLVESWKFHSFEP